MVVGLPKVGGGGGSGGDGRKWRSECLFKEPVMQRVMRMRLSEV